MPTMESHDRKALLPTERVLRTISIVTFFPGIAFLLATGVARRQVWGFVGIAPLSLSGLLAIFVLLARSRPHVFIILMDLFLASFTLAIDIWSWTQSWRNGLVGGHAASALLVNFFIHAFFVLRAASDFIDLDGLLRINPFSSRSGCQRCPHCINEARARKTSVRAVGAKENYHRVPGRDDGYDEDADAAPYRDEGRPSTDDETARLV